MSPLDWLLLVIVGALYAANNERIYLASVGAAVQNIGIMLGVEV